MRLGSGTLFKEVRHLNNGPAGWGLVLAGGTLFLLALGGLGPFRWLAVAVAVVLVVVGATFDIELSVNQEAVIIRWWGRFTRRLIPIVSIHSVDVVLAESTVGYFGGWSSRTSMIGAMVQEAEGERSVGNRAVRLTLVDGSSIQVGCWKPNSSVKP